MNIYGECWEFSIWYMDYAGKIKDGLDKGKSMLPKEGLAAELVF